MPKIATCFQQDAVLLLGLHPFCNHLDTQLVRRWRAGQNDDRLKNGIHISINGIAAGLRNTG